MLKSIRWHFVVLLICMSVLFGEQDEAEIEYAADAVIPISVFDKIILHHEGFALTEMKEIIEKIGGKVHGEGHHV